MNNKELMVIKESFFKKILNRIKRFFKKDDIVEEIKIQEEININNYNLETISKKKDFLNSIKIEENSEILYLKIKLENGEIKAIDLTDEQIDELQEIYDKEIIEKQNKINRLKAVS